MAKLTLRIEDLPDDEVIIELTSDKPIDDYDELTQAQQLGLKAVEILEELVDESEDALMVPDSSAGWH